MDLINEYVKIERTPAPPININTKSSQVLLKDFTGRVIEELAEGYESLIEVDALTQKNRLWQYEYDEKDMVMCFNHMQNASEEMADAMHFMVELLIYANIQPEDINEYVSRLIPATHRVGPELHNNVIAKCMIKGTSDIREMYPEILNFKYVPMRNIWAHCYQDLPLPKNENLIHCGSRYNHDYYRLFKAMLWYVTYHLNIARNFLKNKPWKQSQMMTNEEFNELDELLCYPCFVEYDAFIKTPSSFNSTDTYLAEMGLIRPLCKPDFDNIAKKYSDMYNGNVWIDDSLVVEGTVRKYYSILPRVEIRLKWLNMLFNKYQYNSISKRVNNEEVQYFNTSNNK